MYTVLLTAPDGLNWYEGTYSDMDHAGHVALMHNLGGRPEEATVIPVTEDMTPEPATLYC